MNRRSFLIGSGLAILGSAGLADMLARPLLRSGSHPAIPEQGRWSARSVVMTATETWEGLGILEPSVIYDSGFKMWYRGGGVHGPSEEFGYATSTDGSTWTKDASNPRFGNGNGGETSKVICPFFTKVGSTYYLYYSRLTDNTLKVATSTDGLTWTIQGTCVAKPAAVTFWGNTSVFKEGATWYGYFEAHITALGVYYPYYATSSDGLTWTLGNSGNYLTSLEPSAGVGSSVPHFDPSDPKLGGANYQGWYQAGLTPGISNIYRAYSIDKINWTLVTPNPILTHSGTGYEVGQLADPHLVQVGGTSYMFMDADDNGTDIAAIELVTFAGTLAQLVAGT